MKEGDEVDNDDDDGAADRVCSTRGRESNPRKEYDREILFIRVELSVSASAEERSRRLSDGDDADDGDSNGMVCAAGDGGEAAPCRGCSRSRLRELPYLNTMHYIVRVISYISLLNKHRFNI